MVEHNFNFDESYGLVEYCEAVGNTDCNYRIQECTASDGTSFNALAIPTSEKLEDGRTKFSFFVLSQKLEAKGETLSEQWLAEHKDARVLEPVDGLKFGVLYTPGESSLKSLKSLWD